MDDPVFWGRVRMGWSRDGYKLVAPIWIEERALVECEDDLRQAIAGALDEQGVEVGLSPMVVKRTETINDSSPGELEIVTRAMITPAEAVKLRASVTLLLRNAIAATKGRIEADEAAAKALQEALREPESD